MSKEKMAEKTQHSTANLMAMWQAACVEFPIAGAKWGWGIGKEQEAAEAAWKGYDAWVQLANAQVDELYQNRLFGDLAARSLDRVLRWQRLSNALADAFFSGLWPVVGLPTAAAVQALTEEIRPLTARLEAQDTQIQALRKELRSLAADLPTQKKRRAPPAKLDRPLKTVPAKMNRHRMVTFPTASA
jgi:hypothetical protein